MATWESLTDRTRRIGASVAQVWCCQCQGGAEAPPEVSGRQAASGRKGVGEKEGDGGRGEREKEGRRGRGKEGEREGVRERKRREGGRKGEGRREGRKVGGEEEGGGPSRLLSSLPLAGKIFLL